MKSEKWTSLLSLSLLIVGSTGYFSLHRDSWIFYVFAHMGALGVIGLLACAAGVVARMKRRNYWRAFIIVTLLPIISGLVAVLIFLMGEEGHLYCGGVVSLAVSILLIVFYLLLKKKAPPQRI
jgi:energy-coupling factor transporter transmembrane protein EcfT